METYNGHVRTPNDAIILFEACRLGMLPRVQRRLSEKERQSIRSGSVFVWDEREAGMRRWTDGKSWSASRVSGSFLTYREMEGKRGGSSFTTPKPGNKTPDRPSADAVDDDGGDGPDGYRYKADGLMKQSFSLNTSQGQHLHLISYFSRSHPTTQMVRQPSNDPQLSNIAIPKGMYPEATLNTPDNTPAVTQAPMPGAPGYVLAGGGGYVPAPSAHVMPGYYPGWVPHPGYYYPASPMHPPPGQYPMYAQPPRMPNVFQPPYTVPFGAPPIAAPVLPVNRAPPSSYDQRPSRISIPHSPSYPSTAVALQASQAVHNQSNELKPIQATTNLSGYPMTPNSEAPPPQIDPALTQPPPAPSQQPYSSSSPQHNQQMQFNPFTQPPPRLPRGHTTSTSQAPTISTLIHSTTQGSSSHTDSGGAIEETVSPGGTKRQVNPHDIPSEKLPFREDKMALSKLDRVFAKV